MTISMQTAYQVAPILILTCALFASGCLDESTKQSLSELSQNAQQMQQGAEELGRSLQDMQNNNAEPVEPVDFRALRDLLPERIGSMERSEHEGARQQMGSFTIVNAKAQYDGANRERIELEITDVGAAPGLSMLGLGMLGMAIDRESSTGFERTGTYNGHRMHEEYNTNQERGKRTVLVDQRFVVSVSGRRVPFSTIETAAEAVDLGALQQLAASSQ